MAITLISLDGVTYTFEVRDGYLCRGLLKYRMMRDDMVVELINCLKFHRTQPGMYVYSTWQHETMENRVWLKLDSNTEPCFLKDVFYRTDALLLIQYMLEDIEKDV